MYMDCEIINLFYDYKTFKFDKNSSKWIAKFDPENYKRPIKLRNDLVNANSGKTVLKKGSKINFPIAKKIYDDGLKDILVSSDFFLGKYITNNLKDLSSQEIFLKSGPIASLPMLDKNNKGFRSSIVWTNTSDYMSNLEKVDDNFLVNVLNEHVSEFLGQTKKIFNKQFFSLNSHINSAFFSKKVILMK